MAAADVPELKKTYHSMMFGGELCRYHHKSSSLECYMNFSVFLPAISLSSKIPVLYWLSDSDSDDMKFFLEALPQPAATSHGIAIIVPDTTSGRGFYLNTVNGVLKNSKIYDYVVKELPSIVNKHFKQIDASRASVSGFSTGGHAALMMYMENSEKYKSVSAFAPITNSINNSSDQKVFTNFMVTNELEWKKNDVTCLIRTIKESPSPILIDQGTFDPFLDQCLLFDEFKHACHDAGVPLILNRRPGYGHDYFFVATFIDDHITHHARYLKI